MIIDWTKGVFYQTPTYAGNPVWNYVFLNVVLVVTQRFMLDGADNQNFEVEGADNQNLKVLGADTQSFALVGS